VLFPLYEAVDRLTHHPRDGCIASASERAKGRVFSLFEADRNSSFFSLSMRPGHVMFIAPLYPKVEGGYAKF